MEINFSKRLKQLREEKGFIQREIAEKLNVSRATITQYENNNRFPDQDMLKKIADLFNVSIDYLLGRTDIRNMENSLRNNLLTERLEKLSEDTRKELLKHLELLEIKEKLDKSKDETSSALEKES